MKYCSRFYNYLYFDHYNGDVWMCPWMEPNKGKIGNVLNDKVEDIVNSEHAEQLRGSMHDQSFRYCRRVACPHLQNDDLPDLERQEYEELKKKNAYPTTINLAYDFVCNQSCETCRSSVFVPPVNYAEQMKKIREKIAPYLDTAELITASGHGDAFASPYMMEVLENLHPTNPDMKILLETNGVFFDEEHWERIKHLGEFYLEVVVTSNSFDEFTYRHISRGGSYSKLMNNLELMSRLRREGKIKKLNHSFVIQDRNFREIPSFINRSLNEYAFDSVLLKPVYQWGTMDEEVFWFKDVLNPMHPYHSEYLEILRDPLLKDPRVYNFGGNTVHPARPYPARENNKYFPYDKIDKGSKVVIYGAGQIGKAIVSGLRKNDYCQMVSWIDSNVCNEEIKKPICIADMSPEDYDYIVIATVQSEYAKEMEDELSKLGIPKERIIPCNCGC